jgi:hypothetical protein
MPELMAKMAEFEIASDRQTLIDAGWMPYPLTM